MKKTSCEQRGEAGERRFTCQVKSALLHTAVCCSASLLSVPICQLKATPPTVSFIQEAETVHSCTHTSSVFHHGSVCMTQEGHF